MQFARRYFISMDTCLNFFSCRPLTARCIINPSPAANGGTRTNKRKPAILDILPRLRDNFAQRGLRSITLNSAMP